MKGRPSLLLYGQFSGHHSNAVVSRGIAAGLSANGIEVQLCTTDPGFGFVGGGYQDLWGGPFHIGQRSGGAAAFVGYAGRAAAYLRFHDVKVGFFIAESEVLPADWGIVAGSCDLVVVPSSWMSRAHVAAGVRPDRVMVAAHGLHPCYSQALPTVSGEGLRFLHVAGARDFLHRKGTPELIEAFAAGFGPTWAGPKARLTIRTPSSPTVHELVQATQLPHLFDIDGHSETLPPSTMREYLLHARDGTNGAPWSAVVQPSRAEAFGIVPCEARACGLPVLLTNGSGHRDHLEPSDVLIPTGAPAAPIKVNGIPNGMAPTVSVGAITAALRAFAERQVAYQDAARHLAKGYSLKYDWTVLMRPVAERIRRLCKGGRSLAERVG